MKKILVSIFFAYSVILAQTVGDEKNYLSENRYRISMGFLFADHWNMTEYIDIANTKCFINLSKKTQNYSFMTKNPQIGLVNEFGIKNLSVFLKAGPQVLLFDNFSIDLHFGLSFSFGRGPETSGILFNAFSGICPTYSIFLGHNFLLEAEGCTDISLLNNFRTNTYLSIGIVWLIPNQFSKTEER